MTKSKNYTYEFVALLEIIANFDRPHDTEFDWNQDVSFDWDAKQLKFHLAIRSTSGLVSLITLLWNIFMWTL